MKIESDLDLVKCFLRNSDGLQITLKDNVVQYLAIVQNSHPGYRVTCVRAKK